MEQTEIETKQMRNGTTQASTTMLTEHIKSAKVEALYNGITGIRDDIVERADQHTLSRKKKRSRKFVWTAAMAAVLALFILASSLFLPVTPAPSDHATTQNGSNTTDEDPANSSASLFPSTLTAHAIAEAQYPEMAPYPDETKYINSVTGDFDAEGFSEVYDAWWEDHRAQQRQEEGYANGLESFFAKSIPQFLSGSEGINKVYSPLNVYMALGMLAEITDNNSRQQILDLLKQEDIEALRTQAKAVWNANYSNDGAVTSILASSLWLNENVNFEADTLSSLADNYYASSYQGQMGSAEFNTALQAWLNAQTRGLLEEQTSQITLEPETILALATTVCFQAKWQNEFSESMTEPGTFYTNEGEITCDFMYQSSGRSYYWAEHFSAISQNLESTGSMWFILPDEGITVDQLLAEQETMDFILKKEEWKNNKFLIVNFSVPKFDIVSQMDLTSGLQELGITDVFDSRTSDFSPLTEDTEDIFLSQAKHNARVAIDEEGCTAVAYTVMAAAGAGAPPNEEVDFVLDRPFLFVITGADNLPLFVGVVNQP